MATFIVQGQRGQALKRIAETNSLQKPTKAESSKTSRPKVPDVAPSPSEAPTVIENVPSKTGASPSDAPTVIENVPSETGASPSPSQTPTVVEKNLPSEAEIEVTNEHTISGRKSSAEIYA